MGTSSEAWMVGLFKKLLPHVEGCFVDIGANLGQTLLKLRAVDPKREYVGVEPNPFCLHYLRRLSELNGFQTTFIPAGISDRTGLRKFLTFSDNPADPMASMIEGFRPSSKVRKYYYISTIPFAELEVEIPSRAAIIKIDVEGGELEVLNGMKEYANRVKPIILIELLPVYNDGNTLRLERQLAVERLFQTWGYTLRRVAKTPHGLFAGFEEVRSIGIHSDLDRCDYVAHSADHTHLFASAPVDK